MELLSTLEKIRRRAEVDLRALRLCFSRAVLYQKLNLIPNWMLRGPRSLLKRPKLLLVRVNVPLNFPMGPQETGSEAVQRSGVKPRPGSNPLKFARLKRLNISARTWIPYFSLNFQFLATEKSTFFSPGCRTNPRLTLPNVPGAGNPNAAGFSYTTFSAPIS